MGTGIDSKHKGILHGVSPVDLVAIAVSVCEAFGNHAIDQHSEQFLNVASQLGLDALGLNPCILQCVVQLADVLTLIVGGTGSVKVGEHPVQ